MITKIEYNIEYPRPQPLYDVCDKKYPLPSYYLQTDPIRAYITIEYDDYYYKKYFGVITDKCKPVTKKSLERLKSRINKKPKVKQPIDTITFRHRTYTLMEYGCNNLYY